MTSLQTKNTMSAVEIVEASYTSGRQKGGAITEKSIEHFDALTKDRKHSLIADRIQRAGHNIR